MSTNQLPQGSTWNKFIIKNVTENQEIRVTFSSDSNSDGVPDKYQTVVVTATADGSGTVDPSKKEIALGDDLTFTVTPGEGQALYQIKNGDEILYTNTAESPFNGTFTVSDILANTELTFVFSADTDGDGIPDLSETWFTVTLNSDSNTSIASNGVQDSVRVKVGQDCPVQFSALSGYAIDTVTIDGIAHVNNGRTEAPNGTDWSGITLTNIQDNHTISVTGAATTDDTGVADKYKLKVTPVIVGEDGGEVTVEPVLVVYGHDVTANITPDAAMAVESIEIGTDKYINNPNFGKVFVEDLDGVQEALADPDIEEITFNAPISTESEIQINRPMTINGGGNTVTKSEPGKAFTLTKDSTVEDITIENTADNTEWNSSYGIQFYTGEHTVKNATLTGGNAGIVANSATVNLEGTIDVSNNTFGGIEVCKSANEGMPAGVLNINGATIINTSEAYGKPTIWIDGNTDAEGVVNGADAFTMVELPHGDGYQKQFYLNEVNSKPIIVGDKSYGSLEDAIAAVPDNTLTTIKLCADVDIQYSGIEIPATKKIKLDLNGHTISGKDFTSNGRVITNKGELTIDGNGTITTADCGAKGTGAINNDGTLIIKSGTFGGGDGANGASVNNRATGVMTVDGGTFNGSPRGIQNLNELTINNGIFNGTDSYNGQEGNGVVCGPSSTTTITGGTFIGCMNGLSAIDNANATVTITGGNFKSDGSTSSGAIYNGIGNTLTIEDCIASTDGQSGATIANEGTLHITGGTFNGDNCYADTYTINSGQRNKSPEVTIEGDVEVTGTFGAVRAVSGTLDINGGSYEVNSCSKHSSEKQYYAVYVAGQYGDVTATIDNGTFASSGNAAVTVGNEGGKSANLTINGGTYDSPEGTSVIKTFGPGKVSIYNGSYSSNVESYVPTGYEVKQQDGRYIVAASAQNADQ